MAHFRWRIVFAFILICLGILLILFRLKAPKARWKGGEITLDTTRKEIGFRGFIQKDSGWVQHLIYLKGYKWLKEKSAIVCSVRLKDFQLTFASLDFYLWDSLWQRLTYKKRVKLFIEGIPAESLVTVDEELGLGDFLFLGSPYFDGIALGGGYQTCEECPVFEVEKKALEKLFIRASGKSGYYLRTKNFPKKKEVKIVIKIYETTAL